MKGGVGIIASERYNFSWNFIQSLLKLVKKMGHGFSVFHVQVGNQAEARNGLLKLAKENELDYLVMIDADMTFDPLVIHNLLETQKRTGASIVAGLYFAGFEPYSPVAYRKNVEENKYEPISTWLSVREVDGCGMGMTLITKDLFDIEFDFEKGVGEDFVFCERAKKMGHKIVLDPNVKAGHLRLFPIDESWR